MSRRRDYFRLIALMAGGVVVSLSSCSGSNTTPSPQPQTKNRPPTASFIATPSETKELTVEFDGSSSQDADGRIVTYSWDFGDGETASGVSVEHTYADDDGFNVTLTVTDDRGAAHRFSQMVIAPPVVTPHSWESLAAPQQNVAHLLADIEPADGAVVRPPKAWIRWSDAGGGRVLWHKAGEANVRVSPASGEEQSTAWLDSLDAGGEYEYVVEQFSGNLVQRSGIRSFKVEGGVAFDPPVVEATIGRDYEQAVKLTLKNDTDAPVTVAARALRTFDDLPADVAGPGSIDEPVVVPAHDECELTLAVFAPDAAQETYEIPIEAAGAVARARVTIARPEFDLGFRVVGENPQTLAKRVEITNKGQTLADFSVSIAPPADADVRLAPATGHARFLAGETMTIVACPVLYLEFESLRAELLCSSGGRNRKYQLDFEAPPDRRLRGARINPPRQERENSRDSFCTNQRCLCAEFPSSTGTGPLLATAGPMPPLVLPAPLECCPNPPDCDCNAAFRDLGQELKATYDNIKPTLETGWEVRDEAPDTKFPTMKDGEVVARHGPANPADLLRCIQKRQAGATSADACELLAKELHCAETLLEDVKTLRNHYQSLLDGKTTDSSPSNGRMAAKTSAYTDADGEVHPYILINEDYVNDFCSGKVCLIGMLTTLRHERHHAVTEMSTRQEPTPEDDWRDEVGAYEGDQAKLEKWIEKLQGCLSAGGGKPGRGSDGVCNCPPPTAEAALFVAGMAGSWESLGRVHKHIDLHPDADARLPHPDPERLLLRWQSLPSRMAALGRRSAFSRDHRGAFAAPGNGGAAQSWDHAAGFHAGEAVYGAWHADDHILFAACSPQGRLVEVPAVLGKGRWPRIAARGKRVAVAWRSSDGFAVRVRDDGEWGGEIELSASEAAIAFDADGTLFAAASTGLWKLTDGRFEAVRRTDLEQPSLAFDANGAPHVVAVREGNIVFDDEQLGAGKQPSVIISPDGTAHVAFVSNDAVVVRSRIQGEWSQPQAIPAAGAAFPTMALDVHGHPRLTFIGDADYGPPALWLVLLPEKEAMLMPSLSGNVSDAWLLVDFRHEAPRNRFRPHDVLVTFNGVWMKIFKNAMPEGRYFFRIKPWHLLTSAGEPASNRLTIHTWSISGGHYITTSNYELAVRMDWSEYFAFAGNEEQVIQAATADRRIVRGRPDLALLANSIDLPVKPPLTAVDFPVAVANLGEADSAPTRLVMRVGEDRLAEATVPGLKPGERYVVNMRIHGELESASFEVEQSADDFDAGNGRLEFNLWSKEAYRVARENNPAAPPTPAQAEANVVGYPNDVQPPWVAGGLPVGARAIGAWQWDDEKAFLAIPSHTGEGVKGPSRHYFIRAAEPLPLAEGDCLVQYVYLDPETPPKQILLQMFANGRHEGRAIYWGEDLLDPRGAEAKRMGDLPAAGRWVRLRIPLEEFAADNGWINGLLFASYDGRAFWGPTTKSVSRLDPTPAAMFVSED